MAEGLGEMGFDLAVLVDDTATVSDVLDDEVGEQRRLPDASWSDDVEVREKRKLREVIAEYAATYGNDLIRHGDAEYSLAALERLADSWI